MNLALFSANIFTGDPNQPYAQAVGIEGNKIALVGSNEQIRAACNNDTRQIDLPGRLITPGLVDSHAHFCFFGRTIKLVVLRDHTSLEECLEHIERIACDCAQGDWVIGRGWNNHNWSDKRDPTAKDLDKVTPNNPAMMIRADGHTSWANSIAMKLGGITAETPTPSGGLIVRDSDTGNPTGIFREAASRLIQSKLPATDKNDWKINALSAQEQSLKYGLTGVQSCEGLDQADVLQTLEIEKKLKIRIQIIPIYREIKALGDRRIKPGQGNSKFWYGQLKMFADGTLGSSTALLHEPYTNDPTQSGLEVISVEKLESDIRDAYKKGWSIAIHAIGDKAVTNCLTAIKNARTALNIKPGEKRDRLEHMQLIRPEDLKLFRELEILASVQPVFLPTDWKIAEELWGHERCKHAYAWKSLIQQGIPVQFGSDAPFDDIKPILGLQAAVSRQGPPGQPPGGWFPEERLTLAESITAFTALPAFSAYRENVLGSIIPGKLADLSVFEKDLFETPVEEWHNVEAEMTIIDGEIVYQKET